MKGLILCAGKGTRLQPFSFSQPKTLIPVANKPVLEYCIENLVRQGIKEIGIVINPSQEVICRRIGDGKRFAAKIQYITQLDQRGISHAVKEAQGFIGEDPFVLLLGDNLFAEDLSILLESYNHTKSKGVILLSPVENPQDYGIAEIRGNEIALLEEKPKNPKSNLAVIGAYLFDPVIFKAVNSIAPSTRGEYEITDAIQWLLDKNLKISYSITDKLYSDVGTIERWLEASHWVMAQQYGDGITIGKNSVIKNCKLTGPIIIGENCELRDAEIGPFVSIEDHCLIENCKIEDSIILEKSVVSSLNAPISRSVIGREVYLKGNEKHKCIMNLYLGDKARIEFFDGKQEQDG